MQSKKESLIEACVNTGVGFLTTMALSYPIYWWFEIKINTAQMLGVTAVFTVVSIARGYVVRRWFNNLEGIKKGIFKMLNNDFSKNNRR